MSDNSANKSVTIGSSEENAARKMGADLRTNTNPNDSSTLDRKCKEPYEMTERFASGSLSRQTGVSIENIPALIEGLCNLTPGSVPAIPKDKHERLEVLSAGKEGERFRDALGTGTLEKVNEYCNAGQQHILTDVLNAKERFNLSSPETISAFEKGLCDLKSPLPTPAPKAKHSRVPE